MKYVLALPKGYGKVTYDEPGAAAIAAKACIDIWGVRGKVVRKAKKRRSKR